jgi:hypothetical protein
MIQYVIGFAENGAGGSSVIGQFVSSSGPRGLSTTAKSGGYARTESRGNSFAIDSNMTMIDIHVGSLFSIEMTMLNGKRRISQVAAALSLGTRHIDAAARIFNLALQRNFLQVLAGVQLSLLHI